MDPKKYSVEFYEDELEKYLNEGPIAQQAGRLAGAIGAGAKELGKAGLEKGKDLVGKAAFQLGNKLTTQKLIRTWKSAGQPTDTASIVNILKNAGMSDEQIGLLSNEVQVELKPEVVKDDEPLQALADKVKKSNSADLVKQYLTKAPSA